MTKIYHITTQHAALQAHQTGAYRAPSLDSEGFIHFSTREQILQVANAFYRGQSDLVILTVETSLLQAELRFEAPVHPSGAENAPATEAGQQFPHLYGALNLNAITALSPFPCLPYGDFLLPKDLP